MTSKNSGRRVYCVVTDKYGCIVESKIVTLSVKQKAKITKQPSTTVKAVSGQNAEVTVKATGDGLKYQWYYAEKGAKKFKKLSSAKKSTYSVKMTSKVNGRRVYCKITDQHGKWVEATNEAGDTYTHKNYVNRKYTFFDLMNDAYIPFTFAEFSGADPIEETQCDFSHTGDTITLSQLNAGTVSANYGISDIYAIVLDAQGSEVLRVVKRADQAGLKELNFNKLITAEDWAPYTDGSYTVQIVCQLGTGERPTVYTGTLAK